MDLMRELIGRYWHSQEAEVEIGPSAPGAEYPITITLRPKYSSRTFVIEATASRVREV